MKMASILCSIVLNLIGAIVVLIIGYLTYLHFWAQTYWKRKGLNYLEPQFFFGVSKSQKVKDLGVPQRIKLLYDDMKAKGFKQGGSYLFSTPLYVALDPDIIKQILVKDFHHFMDRGMFFNEKIDPLLAHLFNLAGTKWKTLRTKFTPAFSSGKMKMMFQTFVDCTSGLTEIFEEYALKQEAVDIKEIMARFTTDIISSCAFGIDCNSLKDPNADFRRYGRRYLEIALTQGKYKGIMVELFPEFIVRALGLKFMDKQVEDFFIDIVKKTVDYRENNNIYRKDFMHLLLQLKNRGELFDDESIKDENNKKNSNSINLTMNELTAQAFVFFIAGFETSSTTMTWAIYELSINPEIQETLRDEIRTVLEKHGGQITYDAIMEMTYLDKVVNETLRKYPPIPFLPRICTEDYQLPGTSIILEKNIKVIVPVIGLHMDPDYYPEPEKFDPERFNEENRAKRHPCTFLPFGEGPRICIGVRFGMLQTKVGIITLLKDYKITLNQKTQTPVKISKMFITSAEGGIWINIHNLHEGKKER